MMKRTLVLLAGTALLLFPAACALMQRAPVAAFDTVPIIVYADEPVTFDAGPSTGASIIDYSWSLGDGRTASGREITTTYDDAGVYAVRLVVEDAQGRIAETTLDVPVYVRSGTTIFEQDFSDGPVALSGWRLDSTWASESESTVERVNDTAGYALRIRSTREHWHRRYVSVRIPPLRVGQRLTFRCRVMTLANQEDATFIVIPLRREVSSTAGSLPYYLFTSQGDGSYVREPTAYGTDVGHPIAFRPDVYRWHEYELTYGAEQFVFSVDGTVWYSGSLSSDIARGGEWLVLVGEESSVERCNAYFDDLQITVTE